MREPRGAVGCAQDLLHVLPHRVALPQIGEGQVGVPGDGGEQVVEVVSDAARQPAHRLHLLSLPQLRFEELALGDVFDEDVEILHPTFRVPHDSGAMTDRDGLGVLPAPQGLAREAIPFKHFVEQACTLGGVDVDVRRHVLLQQLLFGVIAQDTHQRWVHSEKLAVRGAPENPERGILDQRAIRRLRARQRLFCPLALEELPNLAPESRRHLEQVGVGLARLAAEELDDAGDARPAPDRKAERAAHTRGSGVRQPREMRAPQPGDISMPDRAVAGPHTTRETHVPHEGHLPRHPLELAEVHACRAPDLNAPERVALRLHDPEDAGLPAETLGDRAQDSRPCFRERLGFCQNAGHGVLRRAPLLDQLALADVAHERAE